MLSVKQLVLSMFIIVSGGALWFLFDEVVSPSPYALADLTLFTSLLGLGFLLLPAWLPVILIFISFLPVTIFMDDILLAAALLAFFPILTLIPAFMVKSEILSRVNFSVPGLLRRGLPTFLSLMAIALAVFFYPGDREITFENIIPRNIFDNVISVTEEIIGAKGSLPRELVYQSTLDLLQARFGAYEKYLPAVFAFGIFALFRTLFIVLGWVSISLALFIFKFLVWTGMVVVSRRPASQEYISF